MNRTKYIYLIVILFFLLSPFKAYAIGVAPAISGMTIAENTEEGIVIREQSWNFNNPPENVYIILNNDFKNPGYSNVGDIIEISNPETGKVFTFDSSCSSIKMPPVSLRNLLNPAVFERTGSQWLNFKIINKCSNSKTVDTLYSLFFLPDEDVSEFLPIMINTGTEPTPSSLTPTPPVSNVLNVPYYSQNVEPWGRDEYDHTKLLGVTGYETTMDRWGCAVTSVAMVLNFHNIRSFADGKPIDPGTLNEWLKRNDGYAYGQGNNGWYSSIKWNAVSKLTQQLYNIGKAPYKLEFNPANTRSGSQELLNEDLTIGNQLNKIPNILFVNNNGHFIVAKGLMGNTYAINDPEWNYSTLSSFNNTYSQAKRFVPSQTDLSYISALVNPDVEILVTDPSGRKAGKMIVNGTTNIYNDIPGAEYNFQSPISNPNVDGTSVSLGTGFNEFLLSKPNDGEYTIELSSKNNEDYTLNVSMYESDGDDSNFKNLGTLNQNSSNKFSIAFSKANSSIIKKDITFAVLFGDLKSFYSQGEIKNKIVYLTLKLQLELSERATQINRQPLGNKLAIIPLKTFILELNKVRGKSITEDAYQILYKDITALIKFLQNNASLEPTPTPGNGGS